MARVITLVTIGTPTAPTVTLTAGGALPASTTYYYRIIAVRRYTNATNVIGLPSPEGTITTDASNKSCTISWSAVTDATHYIIQRTTTSGSYPVGVQNSFQLKGNSAAYNFCTTQLSAIDDGGSASNVIFTAYNFDHNIAYPTIDISVTAGETITMEHIYQADIAGGWGVVDKMVTAEWKAITTTMFTDQVPYMITGSLYVHDCTFQLRGMLYLFGGTFIGGTGVTSKPTLMFGNSSYQYLPYILILKPYSLYGTTNNSTWNGGYLQFGENVIGNSSSRVYGLIKRNLMTISAQYPINSNIWDDGFGDPHYVSGAIYQNCNLGLRGGNGTSTFLADYTGTIFESGRPYANITGATYKYSQWSMVWRNGGIMSDCTIAPPTNDDGLWGSTYGWLHINPKFQSKGQTIDDPYWALVLDYRGLVGTGTLILAHDLKLTVTDVAGNPIDGATVTIKDSLGNSDIWEETTAFSVVVQNNTDTKTTVTTTNPSSLEIGDVVKVMNYTEIMSVDSKPSGTTVTFNRGVQGTTKRAKQYTYSYSYGENKFWKQVASLTTDADGVVEPANPLINRELVINSNASTYGKLDYESNHIANGYLVRNNKTPHTITISKTGYQTKVIPIEILEKTALTISLEKAVDVVLAKGQLAINADPSNSQSDVYV